MPDFTIELREVVARHGTNSLGLDSYPIFDEAYRDILNQKIIDHFWYNEISHETVDMWMRQMRTKMQEIMPYYNKLYEAELIKIDPLSTQDVISTSASSRIRAPATSIVIAEKRRRKRCRRVMRSPGQCSLSFRRCACRGTRIMRRRPAM